MDLILTYWYIIEIINSILSGSCFSPPQFLFDYLHFSSFLSEWVNCFFHKHSWKWTTVHYCFLSVNQTILTAVKVSKQCPSFLLFKSPVCPNITAVSFILLFVLFRCSDFHLHFGYWHFFLNFDFPKNIIPSVSPKCSSPVRLPLTVLIPFNKFIKVILSCLYFPVQFSCIFTSQTSYFIDVCQHKYYQLLFPPFTPIFKQFYEVQDDFLSPAWLITFNHS